MLVYHGTTHKRIKPIYQEGLYVTTDKKKALTYAIESAAFRSSGVPVIVTLSSTLKDLIQDPDEAETAFITLVPLKPLSVETNKKWTKQVNKYRNAWNERYEIMDVVL